MEGWEAGHDWSALERGTAAPNKKSTPRAMSQRDTLLVKW